jgi:hypothetical protein
MARPTGASNKNKQALIRMLQERYPGWHPVMQMADVANDEGADLQTRFNAAKEVAQYVTPKLKATEHRGSEDQPIVHRVVITPV